MQRLFLPSLACPITSPGGNPTNLQIPHIARCVPGQHRENKEVAQLRLFMPRVVGLRSLWQCPLCAKARKKAGSLAFASLPQKQDELQSKHCPRRPSAQALRPRPSVRQHQAGWNQRLHPAATCTYPRARKVLHSAMASALLRPARSCLRRDAPAALPVVIAHGLLQNEVVCSRRHRGR